MSPMALLGLQFTFSLVLFALLAKWYITPALDKLPAQAALVPLFLVHALRYLPSTAFAPGQVGAAVPMNAMAEIAYGDLVSAVLSLIAAWVLYHRWKGAVLVAWVVNTLASLDWLTGVAAQTYGEPLTGMPRELEIKYALSALPPHLRDGATVYVLDLAKGYVMARQGTNSFSCFVARTEYSRAHFGDNLFIPVGYDTEGGEELSARVFRRRPLTDRGKDQPRGPQEPGGDGVERWHLSLPDAVGGRLHARADHHGVPRTRIAGSHDGGHAARHVLRAEPDDGRFRRWATPGELPLHV